MNAWFYFLVRDIDAKLLRRMKKDARSEERSLSDFMRAILCEHYQLDCPPSKASTRIEHGSRTQRLRIQPVLWQALRDDSEETGESMQTLVHEALANRYVTEEAA